MTTPMSDFAGITKPGITMQNYFNTAKTMFVQPSLRPEIDIHGLDYDFARTQPILRNGKDAVKHTVMPTKPALAQGASSSQSLTTSPSYKAVSLPSDQDRQQCAVASETTATLSTKPTSRYTAETFVDAAGSGCLESVMGHIKAGLEVNVGAKLSGFTPLMIAAGRGHEAIVRRLLEVGAYVNQAGDDGVTALIAAALNGHTATVQLLLKAGANCKLENDHGKTALNLAIDRNHKEVIKLLRAHGACFGPNSTYTF